jgi:ribosomal-protein-alanine N-acetyltransferase
MKRFESSRRHLRGLTTTRFDRARFEEMLRSAEMDTNESFIICRSDDDAIVGQINLSQIFRKSFQNAYLGYQLFEGFTGNGFMTEAVGIVLQIAFGKLHLHRIEANVQPENRPSIKVLQRNGFTKEGFSRRYLKIGGRWRDHERWAIVKEAWKKARAK